MVDVDKAEANAEEPTVTSVTDAALDAAAESQDDSKEEPKKELTQEQKDQIERSRLGRRQAQRIDRLEAELLETRRQHNELMERMTDMLSRPNTVAPPVAHAEPEDPDRPLT